MWRDFGSWLYHLTLPEAFLLQSAHPVIAAAVTKDKKYLHDPYGRARDSRRLLWPVVYSRPADAIAMGRKLRDLHRTIRGVDKAGKRYYALDPEAYGWVHMTGFDSAVRMHELFGTPLTPVQRAELFDEWRQIASMLGIAERFLPTTEAEFWSEFNRMIDERLEWTEVLDDTFYPTYYTTYPVPHALEGKLPRPVWRAMMLPVSLFAYWLTVMTLPERAQAKLGLRVTPADKALFSVFRAAVREAWPHVPEHRRYLRVAWRAIEDARKHPEAYVLPDEPT